ncbi:hypothetical protein Dimus_035742, partial [Dionaea muscipula]
RKKLFDAQVEVEEPVAEAPVVPVFPASPGDSSNRREEAARVDPSGPSGHIQIRHEASCKLVLRGLEQTEFKSIWTKH